MNGQTLLDRYDELTPQQRAVFDFMMEGLTSGEIASRMGLSSRTIEDHRLQALKRLGVTRSLGATTLILQAKVQRLENENAQLRQLLHDLEVKLAGVLMAPESHQS